MWLVCCFYFPSCLVKPNHFDISLSSLLPSSSHFISSLNDFQTTFSKRTDFLISLEHYADPDTAMEVLRDEHSRTRVWEVMAQFSTTERILYDGVISLRLDAAYLNDVDIQIKNLQPQVVYLPSNVQSPVASPVNSPVDIGSTMDITINHYKSIALFAYGRFDAMRNYMTSRDVRNYITRIDSFNILQSSSKDIDHSEKVSTATALPSGLLLISNCLTTMPSISFTAHQQNDC